MSALSPHPSCAVADEDLMQALALQQLEQELLDLARSVPWMVRRHGPGYVRKDGLLSLPDGTQLRFTGSLEIVE